MWLCYGVQPPHVPMLGCVFLILLYQVLLYTSYILYVAMLGLTVSLGKIGSHHIYFVFGYGGLAALMCSYTGIGNPHMWLCEGWQPSHVAGYVTGLVRVDIPCSGWHSSYMAVLGLAVGSLRRLQPSSTRLYMLGLATLVCTGMRQRSASPHAYVAM